RDNITASIVDTAASKLLENRPSPEVLTAGGDPVLQRQAENLTSWTDAAVREVGMHGCVEKAWLEAEEVGTGAFRIFERNGAPACEVVYCDEVFVDPYEAKNDAVLTYYRARRMDRTILRGMYPEHEGAIASADMHDGERFDAEDVAPADSDAGTADMVLVVEGYRLALSDDDHDAGRYVVCIEGQVLDDVPYESTAAPFVFMRWRDRPRAFWGIGLVEQTAGIQRQIDEHESVVDEALELLVPSVHYEEGSVKIEQVDNGVAKFYARTPGSQPPALFAPGAAAIQGHEMRGTSLIQRAYQLTGVSDMEAGAQKPAGLNSGRAQLVYQDIKSQRLLRQGRSLEDAYTEGFRRLIEVADGIEAGGDKGKAKDRMRYLAGKGEKLQEISFGEARIADALYRVRVFPVSKLASSPAARLEQVQDMMNAGMIEQEEALELLDFPDVEAYTSRRTAAKRWARMMVDTAVVEGPVADLLTPYDDLGEVLAYGTQRHAQAMMAGSDPDDLTDLRELLAQANALIAAATPPPPPQMPPGAPPPEMAPPMPPGMPGDMPPAA
ncbi:MAG: hypothetical protein ACPGVG_11815, partial [Mycobacterium sp.]